MRLLGVLSLLVVLAALGLRFHLGLAADQSGRKIEIQVDVLETQWWLTRWEDNQIECQIFVGHDNLPTPNEVFHYCGQDLYDEWWETESCLIPEDAPAGTAPACEGLYLFRAGQAPGEKTVVVELPTPSAWVSLAGCVLSPPENRCSQVPALVITAEEPLPNEQIIAVHVVLDPDGAADETVCLESTCVVPLPVTTFEGVAVEFWAESSYGDESERFTALVRVLDGGVPRIPGESGWFVDVLSSQWQGAEIASCAQVWEAFPPPGGPPAWLSTPLTLNSLATDAPYVYLAGQLIAQGLVDTSECPQEGLLTNSTANPCGLESSRELVNEWQDRFDAAILQVAQDTNVPAQMMKNLFAVESQFWPGMLIPEEFGFGQMTDQGADTALLWNPTFFDEYCPLVLDASACQGGYLGLGDDEQALLRGSLAVRTDSSCEDCSLGIDLSQAEFSIGVFAETLLGNCEQAGRIVRNATGRAPGQVSTYEDLWRFSLVNYNAGPGCLSSAVKSTWSSARVLDWISLAPRLDLVCPGAGTYVKQVEGLTREPVEPGPPPDTIPGPYPPPVSPSPTTPPEPFPAPPTPTTAPGPYPGPGPWPTSTPPPTLPYPPP